MLPHQYIERNSGRVVNETLMGDRFVQWLYGPTREKAPAVFKALTSARACRLLSYYNFDRPLHRRPHAALRMAAELKIDLEECYAPQMALRNTRCLFERQIAYWQCRPMPSDPECIISPAEAKVLIGSLAENDLLFIKEKFFSFEDLIGNRTPWPAVFQSGDFALFRLTPEKYHYNHVPVTGNVVDHYLLPGAYHSCNPRAVIATATPYSKNRRMVTIIDTQVPGGSHIGRVAMIEIVALMIGDIVQCYSDERYDAPVQMRPGLRLRRGQPKSLFRPGSSVVVLLFENGRIRFDDDLLRNRLRCDVTSRYAMKLERPLVETEVAVRASIGRRSEPGILTSGRLIQLLHA
ncbi:MAG: phosphatidylserine decarboxylase [Pseudomonadota bacterium]